MQSSVSLPWASSGVPINHEASTSEILKTAKLDWDVYVADTHAVLPGGDVIKLSSRALIRMPAMKRLGESVGRKWNAVQNSEAIDLFKEVATASDMKLTHAGSFKDGKMIWAIADSGHYFRIGEDVVRGCVLFSNPHQYGKSIDVRFMAIRDSDYSTVTWNSFLQVGHRRAVDPELIDTIHNVVETQTKVYGIIAEKLYDKMMNVRARRAYFERVFPTVGKNRPSGIVEKAMSIIDTYPGAVDPAITAWAAFNMVAYMCDHELGQAEDTRLISSWYGKNQKLKLTALRLAAN